MNKTIVLRINVKWNIMKPSWMQNVTEIGTFWNILTEYFRTTWIKIIENEPKFDISWTIEKSRFVEEYIYFAHIFNLCHIVRWNIKCISIQVLVVFSKISQFV